MPVSSCLSGSILDVPRALLGVRSAVGDADGGSGHCQALHNQLSPPKLPIPHLLCNRDAVPRCQLEAGGKPGFLGLLSRAGLPWDEVLALYPLKAEQGILRSYSSA